MKNLILVIIFLSFGSNFLYSKKHLDYSDGDIRQEIIDSVKEIANENVLNGAMVGRGGTKTSQYKRFEFLYTTATEDELLELIDHPNGVVRGYSFWALAKVRSDKLEEVIENHIEDTAMISTISGCILYSYPVIDFMIEVVTPDRLDIDCLKLSEDKLKSLKELRESSSY